MVAKAVQWAKASNKHRVSPVHGEEEIYLILSETFQAKEVEQEEMNREGNMEVQVGLLWNFDVTNCQVLVIMFFGPTFDEFKKHSPE